ncbi:MAG TPA: glycosyltransferase [Candidatus Saccharimonadales bacterium]|nr:glycosyltransferase [Candidatus Saccharimonadales bacterium]
MKKISNILLPTNSLQRKFAKKVLVKLGLRQNVIAGYYNTWVYQKIENVDSRLVREINDGPLISIIVPTYNTPKEYLDELVYSIVSQAYVNWELVLVNASTDTKSREMVMRRANQDVRIKVVDTTNQGISGNTNIGIQAAMGAYIAFCDHDDVLDPFALQEIAKRIIDEKAELIYTDEDKISADGTIYFDPHFKPDWSPDLFTNVNYINHLCVVKRELIIKAGLLNPRRDGAQDYDLLLRIIDLAPRISHVPQILYHWRAALTSTAFDFSSKKSITDAAQLSLKEHFTRNNVDVRVLVKENQPGFYKLQFAVPERLSLIVLPFASDALLRLFIETLLLKTDLEGINVQLIVPNGVQPRFNAKNANIEALPATKHYIRDAIALARAKNAVLLSQIVLPQSDDWLKQLCGPLSLSHVGVVAPLVVRDGCIIEDAGLVTMATGELSMLFKDQVAFGNQTFFGNTNWTRNVDALTGSVMALRTNDMAKFMKLEKTYTRNILTEFSLHIRNQGKYNTLFTEVIMDNHSIRTAPIADEQLRAFFSPNLVLIGKDYEIYTPEKAAINILLRINEAVS